MGYFDDLSFVLVLDITFCSSGERGSGKPYMDRRRATEFIHITTNFKPPYIMGVWVYLKFNQCVSIQYAVDYWVDFHKSVLFLSQQMD